MGLIINVSYDSSVNSAPAAFKSAVNYVVQYFESLFTNSITINLAVGYGEVAGQTLDPGALGESITFYTNSISYEQLRGALVAEGALGSGTLPAGAPTGLALGVTAAQAQALGLISYGGLDGYVGFSSAASFSYNPDVAAAGKYYFVGVVEHEITEVMGRISFLNFSQYTPMDLFRYAAPGIRQFTTGAASYFSIDSGGTNLDNWNNFVTGNSGDLGDWAPSAGNNAFNDNSSPGVVETISPTDLALMNAIGWLEVPAPLALGAGSVAIGAGDFNGDGKADILFQYNNSSLAVFLMNGVNLVSAGAPPNNPGSDWKAIGTGDFNADGDADVLFQNINNGSVALWLMNGTSLVAGGAPPTDPGSDWKAIGTGDFNGDGKADILFQNVNDGRVAIWLMNGTSLVSGGAPPNDPGSDWKAIGAGDFNADGKGDILFQNVNDGRIAIWLMNGTSLVSGGAVPNIPGADWNAIGADDFNGDGKADILFQNINDGRLAVWLMNGTSLVSGGSPPNNPGADWRAVGVGDFNGDGKADVVFQNTNGTLAVWLMNGGSLVSGGAVNGAAPSSANVFQALSNGVGENQLSVGADGARVSTPLTAANQPSSFVAGEGETATNANAPLGLLDLPNTNTTASPMVESAVGGTNLALLCNYLASTFPPVGAGSSGAAIAGQPTDALSEQQFLASPYV